MSKRVIEFDLSPEGLDKAIRSLEKFKNDMMNALTDLLNTLGLRAYGTANLVLENNAKVFSSTLINGIRYEKADGKKRLFLLRADPVDEKGHHYAAFVEFGTGIKGGGHPDEGAVGWKSNASGKGEAGWAFQNTTTGMWYITHGQPATPFMYTAYATVRGEVPKFTATVFAKL